MTTLRIDRTWNGHPLDAVDVAHVVIRRTTEGLTLEVDAPLHGDPPPPGPAGPTPRLWEHEVVEVFVANAVERDRYLEVELSPHGHHLVLSLHGIRRPVRQGLPLDFEVHRTATRWRGVARVPQPYCPGSALVVNAVALWGSDPRRHASAITLPGSAPDFHQPDRFEVEVP